MSHNFRNSPESCWFISTSCVRAAIIGAKGALIVILARAGSIAIARNTGTAEKKGVTHETKFWIEIFY